MCRYDVPRLHDGDESASVVLRELVVRDSVPVSEDEKRTCVVLLHPAGMAGLEQKGELRIGAEDGERSGAYD